MVTGKNVEMVWVVKLIAVIPLQGEGSSTYTIPDTVRDFRDSVMQFRHRFHTRSVRTENSCVFDCFNDTMISSTISF